MSLHEKNDIYGSLPQQVAIFQDIYASGDWCWSNY